MTRKEQSEYWRIRGEEDRIHNRGYHRPHGLLSGLLTWTLDGMRRAREDNQAYHRGWSYRRIATK